MSKGSGVKWSGLPWRVEDRDEACERWQVHQYFSWAFPRVASWARGIWAPGFDPHWIENPALTGGYDLGAIDRRELWEARNAELDRRRADHSGAIRQVVEDWRHHLLHRDERSVEQGE